MVSWMASIDRAWAMRIQCFTLAKTCSMGLRSGEYGGRKRELGAGFDDGRADGRGAVAPEIVENDDVAGAQCRHEELLDVGTEDAAIDRPFDDAGLCQDVDSECRQERERAPAPIACKAQQALAFGAPAADRGHIGLDPGLIDEHQPRGIEMMARSLPSLTPPDDVGAMLLGCVECFF
jgi:hypothetical protein